MFLPENSPLASKVRVLPSWMTGAAERVAGRLATIVLKLILFCTMLFSCQRFSDLEIEKAKTAQKRDVNGRPKPTAKATASVNEKFGKETCLKKLSI